MWLATLGSSIFNGGLPSDMGGGDDPPTKPQRGGGSGDAPFVYNKSPEQLMKEMGVPQSGRIAQDFTFEKIFIPVSILKSLIFNEPSGVPKPSPKFQTPTNPPQAPPAKTPVGFRIRIMKPTEQYQNGYWRLEKYDGRGWQGVNPSNMKVGRPHSETHIPLPRGYKGPWGIH